MSKSFSDPAAFEALAVRAKLHRRPNSASPLPEPAATPTSTIHPAVVVPGLPPPAKSELAGPAQSRALALPSLPANPRNPDGWGKKITDVYPESDVRNFFGHLHNRNEWNQFVMAFHAKDRQQCYYASKKLSAKTAIDRSIATIPDTLVASHRMAYAPYARNGAGETVFGALDFDAHHGQFERAYSYAVAALPRLQAKRSRCTVLEFTGRGFRVWGIEEQFLPCEVWTEELLCIAADIGADVVAGICEVFPGPKSSSTRGYGVRAPGTWNPHTGFSNRIIFENIGPLIEYLKEHPPTVAGSSSPNKDKCFSVSTGSGKAEIKPKKEERNIEKKDISENEAHENYEQGWAERYPINREGGRNATLLNLVGKMFPQVGHDTGRRIALRQYRMKTVTTEATEEQHMKDFTDMWKSLSTAWRAKLTPAEGNAFDSLTNQNERYAFRIFRGFDRYAATKGEEDFPIVRDSIAQRLGLTGPGAGKLIRRFMAADLLRRTQEYVAKVSAARYSWLLRKASPMPLPPVAEMSPPAASDIAPSLAQNESSFSAAPQTPPPMVEDIKAQHSILRMYSDHVLAVLALHEPVLPSDVHAKLPLWRTHGNIYEKTLHYLERRLVIDVTADGRYKLGPTSQHFQLFRAMCTLNTIAGNPIPDTPERFKMLTRHFPFSVAEFVEARDRLLDAGLLVKDRAGCLTLGKDPLLNTFSAGV